MTVAYGGQLVDVVLDFALIHRRSLSPNVGISPTVHGNVNAASAKMGLPLVMMPTAAINPITYQTCAVFP